MFQERTKIWTSLNTENEGASNMKCDQNIHNAQISCGIVDHDWSAEFDSNAVKIH